MIAENKRKMASPMQGTGALKKANPGGPPTGSAVGGKDSSGGNGGNNVAGSTAGSGSNGKKMSKLTKIG